MLLTKANNEIIIYVLCLRIHKSKYSIIFNSEQIFQLANSKFILAQFNLDLS